MSQQISNLNIGDEIGFVKLGSGAGEADTVIFFPVAMITKRDGETAYRYMYPDGELSSAAIPQSQLSSHVIRVRKTTVETIQPVTDKMLNLSARKSEFVEAMNRAKNSNLEVFNDWERDAFVVVNNNNGAEYHVCLQSREKQLHANCECPDFVYRKRICKHISEVLTSALFSLNV